MTVQAQAQPGAACYAVPKAPVEPGGEQAYGHGKIMSMLHGLRPGEVQATADDFLELSQALEELRAAAQTAGTRIANGGSWKGQAASAAMSHLQQLHDQTARLSAQAETMSNTMDWLGTDVMPKFQSIPSPTVASKTEQDISNFINNGIAGGINGQQAADQSAQHYLRTFNGHLATANAAMPSNLSAPKSSIASNPWGNGSSTGAQPGTGSGTNAAAGYAGLSGASGSGGSAAPSYTPSSSANPFSAAKLAHAGSAPSASLQGYAPPASGAGANPFAGSPAAGGGANPFSGMVVPSAGGSGFGGGGAEPAGTGGAADESDLGEDAFKVGKSTLPGEDSGPGVEGGAGDAAGSEAAGARAGAEGTAGEGSSGMGGMGSGGGGGSQDKERQRQAWMNQDQEIWGVSDRQIGSVLE